MAAHPQAERALIESARSGDRAAQQALWRIHRRWVAAIVLAHRPHSMEVDDLMQDVAVRFISKVETLRDPEALRPWLRQIVINVCRGAARNLHPALHLTQSARNGEERVEAETVGVPEARDATSREISERGDLAQRLLDQLMTLPSEYREPMLLRCLRSMSYEQISHLLELPVTTVETRLARARRMLREEIGEERAPSSGRP